MSQSPVFERSFSTGRDDESPGFMTNLFVENTLSWMSLKYYPFNTGTYTYTYPGGFDNRQFSMDLLSDESNCCFTTSRDEYADFQSSSLSTADGQQFSNPNGNEKWLDIHKDNVYDEK